MRTLLSRVIDAMMSQKDAGPDKLEDMCNTTRLEVVGPTLVRISSKLLDDWKSEIVQTMTSLFNLVWSSKHLAFYSYVCLFVCWIFQNSVRRLSMSGKIRALKFYLGVSACSMFRLVVCLVLSIPV